MLAWATRSPLTRARGGRHLEPLSPRAPPPAAHVTATREVSCDSADRWLRKARRAGAGKGKKEETGEGRLG
uniref:Uncharacterized protein n=1 Tax=Sphaerodactylus townsendi TaxID=933632 RepID=A0ACB8F738_9SAUR